MSDLREAIVSEDWDVKGSNAVLPWRDLVVLIEAARRWLALTETGPDYEAAAKALWSVTGEVDGQWPTLWETHTEHMRKQARYIVDAALADYLTEEDR